jgi:mannose-6-phosphate isomerase-like protein (cupin superfamily)
MAVFRGLRYTTLSEMDDPDDFRPGSRLGFAVDPGDEHGRVDSISLFFEVVGPGEIGPMHVHAADEAIFIEDGELEVQIGDQINRIKPEEVAFIPRNVPHGWRNVGTTDLTLRAIHPTNVITIVYQQRNPAPGTEGDAPQPPTWIDLRTLI